MNTKLKNEYVQPECVVDAIELEQIIAISGESGTEDYDEENYGW